MARPSHTTRCCQLRTHCPLRTHASQVWIASADAVYFAMATQHFLRTLPSAYSKRATARPLCAATARFKISRRIYRWRLSRRVYVAHTRTLFALASRGSTRVYAPCLFALAQGAGCMSQPRLDTCIAAPLAFARVTFRTACPGVRERPAGINRSAPQSRDSIADAVCLTVLISRDIA